MDQEKWTDEWMRQEIIVCLVASVSQRKEIMFGSDANDLFFNSARKTTSYRARQFKMSHEICSIDGICSENACKLFTSKPQYFFFLNIYKNDPSKKNVQKKNNKLLFTYHFSLKVDYVQHIWFMLFCSFKVECTVKLTISKCVIFITFSKFLPFTKCTLSVPVWTDNRN